MNRIYLLLIRLVSDLRCISNWDILRSFERPDFNNTRVNSPKAAAVILIVDQGVSGQASHESSALKVGHCCQLGCLQHQGY